MDEIKFCAILQQLALSDLTADQLQRLNYLVDQL
jgi:hypothetical protein